MSASMFPASQQKLEANRANALKSTGPRTAQGKAKSSRNAVTHGVLCKDLLHIGEETAEFRDFKIAMLRRLNPRDFVERQLAEQIIAADWRIRRVWAAEFCEYDHFAVDRRGRLANTPGEMLAAMVGQSESSILMTLQRYEQRLTNMKLRCLHELRQLQKEPMTGTLHPFTAELLDSETEGAKEVARERGDDEIEDAEVEAEADVDAPDPVSETSSESGQTKPNSMEVSEGPEVVNPDEPASDPQGGGRDSSIAA